MKFEEILPALRDGKKIRRKAYPSDYYLCLKDKELHAFISFFNRTVRVVDLMVRDLLADDWEIIKEKKKVKFRDLTMEQFKKYCKSITQAPSYGKGCSTCPFHNVSCTDWYEECWINHKDLYSDKFLDQEIEIEEE